MKQDTILSTLILIVSIYIVVSLSLFQSLISIAAGVIAYQISNSLLAVLIVLVSIPVIVELNRRNFFRSQEGFHTDGAVAISNRVKQIQKSAGGKQASNVNVVSNRLPENLKGVLESPEIESFQNIDASGEVIEKAEFNAPGFSVPAFVREKGRLLVVPEMSVPRISSPDTMPKPNPMMEKPDDEGVATALVSDAASIPVPESEQGSNRNSLPVGPSSTA